MSQSPFKTPKFKALFQEWNAKLKDSGFEDIEDFTLEEPWPVFWDNFHFSRMDPDVFKARQLYYEKARALLHTYKFFKPEHKQIWAMYSEGSTIRQIAEVMNKKKYKKSTIFNIVREIQEELK